MTARAGDALSHVCFGCELQAAPHDFCCGSTLAILPS
jgi:hypothetical protein